MSAMGRGRVAGAALLFVFALSALLGAMQVPAAASPGDIVLASCNSSSTCANQPCAEPALSAVSADGHYVVFTSNATNLVSGISGYQVYRKDLDTGQVKLCSSSATGAAGNDSSMEPSISADGR